MENLHKSDRQLHRLISPEYTWQSFDKYLRKREEAIKKYELEVRIDHAEYGGVPIKGVLDRVDVYSQQVVVTDYKTGNAGSQYAKAKLRPPTAREPKGGDYWRQIVFYQMLKCLHCSKSSCSI